jgi:hypothetical protein
VVVGVTIPAEGEALTIEHEQDLHRNVQATRVITGSLCAQEFNKVWNIQIAKVIWDTLKEAHEGTEHVIYGKMDLINGELELFFMRKERPYKKYMIGSWYLSRTLELLEVKIGMIQKSQRSC